MPKEFKLAIEARIKDLKHQAQVKFDVNITPTVSYKTKGTVAGYADFGKQALDFNLGLALDNKTEFLDQIVGHEFSHLIAHVVFEEAFHGSAWKEVMRTFGLRPERCHNLDVSGHRRNPPVYRYHCGCGDRFLSKAVHDRIGQQLFTCNTCHTLLVCLEEKRIVRPGTKMYDIQQTLVEYHEKEIPPNESIMLIMDLFDVAESSARTYFYALRPRP